MMSPMYQFRAGKRGIFMRLMMQDTSTGVLFDDQNQAKHYTDQKNSEYKFSIIDQIDEIQRYDSQYYEFLHCFSENNIELCNHWRQKVSPLNYTEKSDLDWQEIGLIPLDPSFLDFKGLMLSTSFMSLLDGYSKTGWRYAAGVYRNYLNNFYIPGPTIEKGTFDVHKSILYLRVPNMRITCRNYFILTIKPIIITFIIS